MLAASCTTGFVNDVSGGTRHGGEQWVFPNINFTCRGEVTKVIFGGSNFRSYRDQYPEVHIRRRNEGGSAVYTKVGSVLLDVPTESPNGVYTINVDPGQLQFEEDDVLGVFLPYPLFQNRINLHFNDAVGPSGYYTSVSGSGAVAAGTFALSGANRANVQPLITVELGKCYLLFLILLCLKW